MIVLDNGDAIRGVAEVIEKLDFTVNGYVGTTATQLADGQMHNAEADLYASGANATVVTSITVVNTDSVARTFTLYLKPSAGTSRAISPVSLDLGIGHCFYTDGQRMAVMNLNGEIINAWAVDDTPVNGEVNHPISSNYMYDHLQAADPHAGYILESFMDAKGDLIAASADDTPVRVAVGTDGKYLKADSAAGGGVSWSTISALTVAETEVFAGASPESWTDLDLSATIGSQARLVLLKGTETGNAGIMYLRVRKNGDTDEFLATAYGCAVGYCGQNSASHSVVIVATDASGVIEWITNTARTCTLDVIAYL